MISLYVADFFANCMISLYVADFFVNMCVLFSYVVQVTSGWNTATVPGGILNCSAMLTSVVCMNLKVPLISLDATMYSSYMSDLPLKKPTTVASSLSMLLVMPSMWFFSSLGGLNCSFLKILRTGHPPTLYWSASSFSLVPSTLARVMPQPSSSMAAPSYSGSSCLQCLHQGA